MLNLLFAITMEILIYPFYFVSLVLSPLFKLDNSNNQEKKKVIILHGGWFSRGSLFILLKKRLENLDYTVYIPDYGYHLCKIEETAEKFEDYIKKNKIGKFIFIGHSLGGLIGLYYHKNHKNKITKFISLGTPFYGAKIAKIPSFFSESAKQMIPDSLFLKGLHKNIKVNKNFYSIGSKHDQFIPIKSSKLKKAKNIEVNFVGHSSMLFSKEVFREIKHIVEIRKA